MTILPCVASASAVGVGFVAQLVQASAAKNAAERTMFFIFDCYMFYSIIWYEVWLCMK
jgi:hypothetical protein